MQHFIIQVYISEIIEFAQTSFQNLQ